MTLLVRLINRYRDGIDVGWLAAMAPYIPFAIRLHLAVSLIGLFSLGFYLSPAMDLETDIAGISLGVVMALARLPGCSGCRSQALQKSPLRLRRGPRTGKRWKLRLRS